MISSEAKRLLPGLMNNECRGMGREQLGQSAWGRKEGGRGEGEGEEG